MAIDPNNKNKTGTEPEIYQAGLLIIGNEILSGRTQDTNAAFLGQKLNDLGIRLSEIRVVPDIEAEIVNALDALRNRYNYVFTTGGIGPTHDDITSACVAKAFGVSVRRHPDAVAAMQAYYAEGELTDARLKMAEVPEGATLINNPVSSAPGFVIGNVHVMAGVPRIMQAMFDMVAPTLKGGAPIKAATLRAPVGESVIADEMTRIQGEFSDVDIGSYPGMFNGQISVAVVVRSVDENKIKDCVAALKQVLDTKKIPFTFTKGY